MALQKEVSVLHVSPLWCICWWNCRIALKWSWGGERLSVLICPGVLFLILWRSEAPPKSWCLHSSQVFTYCGTMPCREQRWNPNWKDHSNSYSDPEERAEGRVMPQQAREVTRNAPTCCIFVVQFQGSQLRSWLAYQVGTTPPRQLKIIQNFPHKCCWENTLSAMTTWIYFLLFSALCQECVMCWENWF